jgi:hypothetical protein
MVCMSRAAVVPGGEARRTTMATTDFTKMMQDMMSAMPMDMSAFNEAFKSQAAYSEKMSKVMLDAADKTTEVSAAWTKATIAKVGDMTAVKKEPTDYAKSMTEFASAQAEMASEHMAAFAEIAKRMQMDTVELMLAAGKEVSAEATAAVQKATTEVTAAAKKATDEVAAVAKKASATAK